MALWLYAWVFISYSVAKIFRVHCNESLLPILYLCVIFIFLPYGCIYTYTSTVTECVFLFLIQLCQLFLLLSMLGSEWWRWWKPLNMIAALFHLFPIYLTLFYPFFRPTLFLFRFAIFFCCCYFGISSHDRNEAFFASDNKKNVNLEECFVKRNFIGCKLTVNLIWFMSLDNLLR